MVLRNRKREVVKAGEKALLQVKERAAKVAIYIRWSTDDQANGTTLETQLERCRFYALSKGWQVEEGNIFIDDGYSGGNLARPGLTELRERVQVGEIDTVIVYRLDRLSRRLLDCVSLVMEEWKDKCSVYSTSENIDTETPTGRMVFNILASFAEYERDVIRERTYGGKLKRAKSGSNAGHKYPYGLKRPDPLQPFHYQGKIYHNFAIDSWTPEEGFAGKAAVVRRVYDLYRAGHGFRAIARILNEEGIPSYMGKLWRPSQIQDMLKNPAYKGVYTYGGDGIHGHFETREYIVPDAIPPIIPPEEWDEVQGILEGRSQLHPRQANSDYLLSGIATCGKCGYPMTGRAMTKKGKKYRYYACTQYQEWHSCDCANVPADRVEGEVVRVVKETFALDRLEGYVSRVKEALDNQRQSVLHAISEIQAKLKEQKQFEEKLDQDYTKGLLPAALYSKKWEELQRAIADLEEQLAAAEAKAKEIKNTSVDTSRIEEVAKRIDAWDTLTAEQAKRFLMDVTAKLTIYQKRKDTSGKNSSPIEVCWTPAVDMVTWGQG